MGTPALPNLGKHCSVEDCRQIDFLPFTCDRCHQLGRFLSSSRPFVLGVILLLLGCSIVRCSSVNQRIMMHICEQNFGNRKWVFYKLKGQKPQKVLCLEHRSYAQHSCPNANQQDVTVLVCPLCAKGVRLISSEDPNITWESHVNTDCDPSNYEKATKKKRCPVPSCKEILVFSNTIKCRDCNRDHCLKHRFGLDHNCPGPKKPDTGFPFMGMLKGSQKGPATMTRSSSGSTWWGSGLLSAASSVRASAESSLTKLSSATSQALQKAKDGMSQSSVGGPLVEQCVQCPARFSSVTALIDHVEKVHESGKQISSRVNTSIDVCPKCSKGFSDPVSLVMHVERDHGGTSIA